MDGCSVIDQNTLTNVAFVETDDLADISDCNFAFGTAGHAIEIRDGTGSPFTFDGNTFTGSWGGTPGSNLVENSGSSDAMILNSSLSAITINVSNGTTVSVRNTGTGSTTTVSATTTVTLTGLVNPTEVRVYTTGTTTELDGQENVTTGTFAFGLAPATFVDIRIYAVSYDPIVLENFEIPASNTSIPIVQIFDRNYRND
jgi:hypothetical protein